MIRKASCVDPDIQQPDDQKRGLSSSGTQRERGEREGLNPSGMRLLTLSPYRSRPPQTGGTKRIHFLNRGYCRAGWDVLQISGASTREGIRGLLRRRDPDVEPGYREEVYFNPLMVLANRLFRKMEAPQVAASILPRALRPSPRIRTELENRRVVLLEHPNYFDMVVPLLSKNHVLVLDAHNIEYKMFEKHLGERGPVGTAARNLFLLEKNCFTKADLVFTCSSVDRDIAIHEFGADPSAIHVAPNGVDIASTPFVTDMEREAAKRQLGLHGLTALFVGSRWPPNTEGAAEIIRMATTRADVTYLVVGAAGNALVGKNPPNVIVTGAVDDLRPYVAASDLALNPVVSGSGSNVKMFEYLAAGLPVVSTAFGARGVDDFDGLSIVQAELGDIPYRIVDIAADPQLAARRIAARRLVEAKYDWTAIAARISETILAYVRSRTG